MFELEFISREQEVEIYRLFELVKPSDYGERRNLILSYSKFETLHDKQFRDIVNFKNKIISKIYNTTYNIYQFSFNNKLYFHINFYIIQEPFGLTKEQKVEDISWDFIIETKDISLFKNYIEKATFEYSDTKLKIKNTLNNF